MLAEARQGRLLDRALEAASPSETDRGWVQELTYGVERLRGRLDHLLEPHLERGLASLPEPVQIHLQMGLYQLLYMNSVPTYAAVSQTVAGVRAVVGPGMAPLTNAVLRRAAEAGEDLDRFPDASSDIVGYLSTWGAHPRWLVERWVNQWGADQAARVVEANNQVPGVTVRPARGSLAEAREILAARGIESRVVGSPGRCLEIEPARRVAEALEAIEGYAQDPAAAAVAAFCGFGVDARVVDLCAAPGGKAMALANQGARVFAFDRSESRAALIRRTARRLGVPVLAGVADGRRPAVGPVEGVLLDVPCTGTGTLRRHPDAKWKLSREILHSLVRLQADLLDGAASIVRPGGTLVYATCSLEEEENERQVERFLGRHDSFRLKSPPKASFEVHTPARTERRDGLLRLFPTDTGYDGAFAARMVRIR